MPLNKETKSIELELKNKYCINLKECPLEDTKLHRVMRLQFQKFKKCEVPFHWHYSQVHSEAE